MVSTFPPNSSLAATSGALVEDLKTAKEVLDVSRPTAVNLSWATARLLEYGKELSDSGKSVDDIKVAVRHHASP